MKFIQPNIILYLFLMVLGLSGFFFTIFLPQSQGFYAFIALAATGGLGVSIYIYQTKRNHKQLVCPIGSDCNVVISSKYSKFLGVPLEYWGMFYYSLLILSYVGLIFASYLMPHFIVSGLIFLTASAFLFSLYLLFVQGFLLRQWCIWCLLSAMLSILIFIISLSSVDFVLSFLLEASNIIGSVGIFGFILGIGGVTISLFLFNRFLKDSDVDVKEMETQKAIGEVILLGLIFVFASHFSFYIIDPTILSSSGYFLVRTIALFVVTLGHTILMTTFSPLLSHIPFRQIKEGDKGFIFQKLRKPFFIISCVVFTSWYFAFFVEQVTEVSFYILSLLYLAYILFSIFVALLWDRNISNAV